ncbi:hypothetical protein [Bacteroides sp. 224]|uniref:hypothetical protein n=1 Tax=Bacteroides sp. 224 TaxID=2302936 RepID=UPI0013D6DEEF|nr:hypothetical protein [Bacteroides sp. 224]NDV63728.1 hypothetical protein [Bacteroides sp. 224]
MNSTVRTLAPVALFVYDRLQNTKKTIEHLQRNRLASESILYVFSDGGKDEKSWTAVNHVRQYLHSISGFKEIHLIERAENFYLERNIIEGISYVLSRHETIIVLEDDICTSPIYLDYINEALNKYKDEPKVMHISGFTNLDIPTFGDTYFTPHMSGWGWATWKGRWQLFTHYNSREEALAGMTTADLLKIEYGGAFSCLKSLNKNPIPWDICWEILIHKRKGLCLTPTHTLIKNIGIGSGTHFKSNRIFGWYDYDRPFRTQKVVLEDIPIEETPEIEAMYAKALKDHGMKYNLFGKITRFFYKILIR